MDTDYTPRLLDAAVAAADLIAGANHDAMPLTVNQALAAARVLGLRVHQHDELPASAILAADQVPVGPARTPTETLCRIVHEISERLLLTGDAGPISDRGEAHRTARLVERDYADWLRSVARADARLESDRASRRARASHPRETHLVPDEAA